ncbi:uncharacterized protein [Mycetomoellerius zeteki]|uniref:uncharacterized protein n=1 Tax=Mycetomoellerius zeteki TaxID=64791 RepID=UPI00084E6EC8|nr:PREDICTED: uncharacterized protein LOC108730245 [Trachymyrmex zeteki]
MAFTEFYNVFGNLELMVMSLVETIVHAMTFSIVWLIHSNNLLKIVIDEMKKDIAEHKFENSEEEIIYYNYNRISKIFTYGSNVGMLVTTLLLYFRPLMYLAITNQAICHMAAICLVIVLVFHICGELAILSYRIRHVEENSQIMLVHRFRNIVRMHLKIIR